MMDMSEVRKELQKAYGTGYYDGYSQGYTDGCADAQPTTGAEPVVRCGHYIKGENGERYCSNCKRIDDKYSVARFCWYCGAKMNKE